MSSYDTAQPHLASFVIFRKKNKIAFVLRANTAWMDGYYGLPSGRVEKGESFGAAAVREAVEEVGATVQAEQLMQILTMHRTNPDKQMEDPYPDWVDVYFEATSWEGELYNAEPEVHSELTWLDADNLPDNIVPGVREALKAIKAGKTYAEYGWN